MNVTLRQLRAFVETCRSGKLTLAAQRLHVTPGASSMLIKRVESELGVPLFVRAGGRLRPTEAAAQAVAVAERMLADLERLVEGTQGFDALARGRVAIAATPALVSQVLPGAILRLREQHPGIVVDVHDCAPEVLWSLVADEHADLGIGTPEQRDRSLEWDVYARDRLCVVCRSDHAFAAKTSVRWPAAAAVPFITVKRGSGIRRLVDEAFARAGIDARPQFEVSYLESALAMAQAGLGIALLPSYFVTASTHGRGLVARPLVSPAVQRDILLLRRRGVNLSPAARRLREVLLAGGRASI